MIYFLQSTQYVKIGYTNNLTKRINQIQVSNPEKLELILVIDGDYDYEQKIHKDLINDKSNGEWFFYSDNVKKYIHSLTDKDIRWQLGITKQDNEINSLRNLRNSLNLSCEDVAQKLGITKQSYFDSENRLISGNITIKTLQKIAKAIGYRLEYRFKKL